MESKDGLRASLKSLKSLRPEAVSIPRGDLVRAGELSPGQALPLVFEPTLEEVELPDWARANAPLIEERLRSHGAILFRGFRVETARDFEGFALATCRSLYGENGEHPRETVSGQVYTPVFYPPDKHLLWHNENSFNETWPTKILFCCLTPATSGGETPIVDSRRVYHALDPALRRRFIERGVMYLRNYTDGVGLGWQTVFRTTSRAEVEHRCRANGFEFEWTRGGEGFRTRCVRPAVINHPQTGEPSWFNQAQHWHVSCLEPDVRHRLRSIFDEQDLPRNCFYGDGSPVEDSVMDEILAVYRELEVSFPWRAGDILLVDNILSAHARNAFEGERKMLVALGDMSSYGAAGRL